MHSSSSGGELETQRPVCRICWESTCEVNGAEEFLSPHALLVQGRALQRPPGVPRVSLPRPPHVTIGNFHSSRASSVPRLLLPSTADRVAPRTHTPSPRRWILEARSQGRFDAGTICHACGDNYSHPALSRTVLSDDAVAKAAVSAGAGPGSAGVDHREPLAVIGGTGYVGRSVALHLLGHPTFRLGAIVGSSATVGKPFSAVFEKKEESLAEHYGADLWKPMDFPTELMSARGVQRRGRHRARRVPHRALVHRAGARRD